MRSLTLGRLLLAAGSDDDVSQFGRRPSLTWSHYGDGSWWIEVHAFGRYAGIYR